MKLRIAKKVMRASRLINRVTFTTYRDTTFVEASRRLGRVYLRSVVGLRPRTSGWRWGKWDPSYPLPPWELPF